jgi:hypothetical protein
MEILLRRKAPRFPIDRFPSVQELCFAAVRRFSPVALRCPSQGPGTGAVVRPLGAQFQDEFYKACFSILGHAYLTSEWTGKTKRGRVDFQISSLKWGIEIVREGDRIEQHIQRFQPGGKYYPWILSGDIKKFIVLDFRTIKPKKVRGIVISFGSSRFDKC